MNCKIPKLYRAASSISQSVKEENKGISQLLYDKKYDHFNRKGLLAIVTKVIKNYDALENAIKESHILEKEPYLKPWIVRVLLCELLSGRNLPQNNKTCQTILKYRQEFPDSLENAPEQDHFLPRYVRVNTLKTTVESVLGTLEQDGWSLIETPQTYKKYLKILKKLSTNDVIVDFHLPEVLAFHPKATFFDTELFRESHIILQDKTSCVSAYLLAPKPSSTVLDMCAAPGLKTSYLAALLNNEGTVYAVDINPKRYKTMTHLMTSYGASCVVPLNLDSCNIGSENFSDVKYILLDPPCSGSGIVKRIGDQFQAEDRLRKLSNLQSKLLRHALTKFPLAKKIVYSTCSICPEENEAVIDGALKGNYSDHFKLVNVHKKLKEGVTPGSDEYQCGKFCAYFHPDKDLTNGFFIAMFKRIKNQDDAPADEEAVEEDATEETLNKEVKKGNKRPIKEEVVEDVKPKKKKKNKKAKHLEANENES